MQISSSAFDNRERIPDDYTCHGRNVNPHLIITDVPDGAQSLVLIMDDPDAPSGTFIHWLIWNIPPDTSDIPQGGFIEGAEEGINSAGGQGYTGPCPPSGIHRYFFNLYALDTMLSLEPDSSRSDLESMMNGHVLEEAKLLGLYGRE